MVNSAYSFSSGVDSPQPFSSPSNSLDRSQSDNRVVTGR